MSKKRLLVFHPALAPYRVDFFNSLNQVFESKFYFFYDNLINQKFDQDKLKADLTFQCNYLDKGVTIYGRNLKFDIHKIIKDFDPHYILGIEFNISNINLLVSRYILRKKFKLYTICDDNISIAKNRPLLIKLIRRVQLSRLDGIIFTHKQIADWYRSSFNLKYKSLLFPIIREESKFLATLSDSFVVAEKYIEKYNLNNKKVFLFVGRIELVKNLERLIEAFSIIFKEDNTSRLIIVGDGKCTISIKNKISKLNLNEYVYLPGRFEAKELFGWYIIAGIFILPSTFEPFGAVVNEALLSGCYVLCSKTAGASSLIVENVNGNIFNPYNINEIAETMKNCLKQSEIFKTQGRPRSSRMTITYQEVFRSFITGFE